MTTSEDTKRLTRQDLAGPPETPEAPDRSPVEILLDRDRRFQKVWKTVSKRFATPAGLASINGPAALRHALGLSLARMAELLVHYHGRHYCKATLSIWERPERGVVMPRRYHMTPATRGAYARLLGDLVDLANRDRRSLAVRAHLGARRWRFALVTPCQDCGRPFALDRAGVVRCKRCRSTARSRTTRHGG